MSGWTQGMIWLILCQSLPNDCPDPSWLGCWPGSRPERWPTPCRPCHLQPETSSWRRLRRCHLEGLKVWIWSSGSWMNLLCQRFPSGNWTGHFLWSQGWLVSCSSESSSPTEACLFLHLCPPYSTLSSPYPLLTLFLLLHLHLQHI